MNEFSDLLVYLRYIECLLSALGYFEGFKDETIKYKIAFLTNSVIGKNRAWGCNTVKFNLTMRWNHPQDIILFFECHAFLPGESALTVGGSFSSLCAGPDSEKKYDIHSSEGRADLVPIKFRRHTGWLPSIAWAKLNLFETSTPICLDVYLTHCYLIYFPCQVSGGNSSQCQSVNVLLHNPVTLQTGECEQLLSMAEEKKLPPASWLEFHVVCLRES